MRKIDGMQRPGGAGLGVRFFQPGPEKGELIAEGLPFLREQMPGVIPPLGFIRGMRPVVPGKLEDPSRPGEVELRGRPWRPRSR